MIGEKKEDDIMKKWKKCISVLLVMTVMSAMLTGCVKTAEEESNDNVLSDNIVITETGEVIEKVPQPTATPDPTPEPTQEPIPEPTQEPTPEPTQEPVQVNLGDTEVDVPDMQEEIVEQEPLEMEGKDLQLVFMGDSIFDAHRDGTGIPYLTAVQCDADVYNLAIGGTAAALDDGEPAENENWSSWCLVGMVKALKGEVPTSVFEGTNAKAVLDTPGVDFSETDYFIIEYGVNDFFEGIPLDDSGTAFNLYTYVGALRYAVVNLRELAPDATIILCSPHYCQFFKNNQYIGDGNVLSNAHGTLFNYKGKCLYVVREQQTEQLDAYFDLGIDGYTAKEYLEDGIHLTDKGRQVYADALAKKILNFEKNKNN